jgi:hypothetical protein
MSKTLALLTAALMFLLSGSAASLRAQGTTSHPDFTGVYYPFNPNAAAPQGAAGTSVSASAAPRPVAVIDGREGRPPDLEFYIWVVSGWAE